MTEIEKALLGDKESQANISARGELIPCPRCGSTYIHIHCKPSMKVNGDYEFMVYAQCESCHMQTGYIFAAPESYAIQCAIRSWNKRKMVLTTDDFAKLNIEIKDGAKDKRRNLFRKLFF